MKILIGIVYLILILIGILLIAALAAPRSKTLERSIEIEAKPSVVFSLIAKFENWKQWDPWFGRDPEQSREFKGQLGDSDYGYTWVSEQRDVGVGSIRMDSYELNKQMAYRLTMGEGFTKMGMDGQFTLEQEHETTKVTWKMLTAQSFPMNIMHYMTEKWVGPDYEAGLAHLKEVAEATAEMEPEHNVEILSNGGVNYAVVRQTVKFKDINAFCDATYPVIYDYINENGLQPFSGSSALYFTWDQENKETQMATAVAISAGAAEKADSVELAVGTGELFAQSVRFMQQGDYVQSWKTHSALSKWIEENGKTVSMPCMEEYVKGPHDKVDSTEYLTRITYFFD
jgi:effector-binding domain-containing protein